MSFIDIHGHYAWNIDDGMPSYDDARKALELARENRISAIVATPHVTPEFGGTIQKYYHQNHWYH